ncbi:MAG: Xaa-Pro dipeptidase [Gammaproteobacteria bacterium]|nr:Xaa-Pro dipeptidase [Gammaproteobacteria bacterium]
MTIEQQTTTDHYAEHVAYCQDSWESALAAEGFEAAVIHAGSQIISFLDDYHYPFRPNPHFVHWLPLTHHHDSVLFVQAGQKPKLVYYQPDDYWYLPPADPEAWWADHFEVITVQDPLAWQNIHMSVRTAYIGDAPCLAGVEGEVRNPERLVNRIHLARSAKTEYEIACIAASARTAAAAHLAAEAAFRQGCSEYEIHMRYLQACGLVDHQLPYGNIVALNDHGAVLHYQDHDLAAPRSSRSFLIDAGATHQGYCSDITRTYACADGEFTDMIAAMDEMQLGLCDDMRAGRDYRDLHIQAHHRISSILENFGIINTSAESAVQQGLSSVFFPHGLGHFLGIQTHDVAGLFADADGTPIPRPEGHPFLRLTRVLEAGNVLTVEPGLYFIPSLLEKWRRDSDTGAINWDKVESLAPFGGIRIEDDVLVTDGAPVNLSRRAFAEI